MANENDKKIKDLLSAIESKKKELGTKPRLQLKTNGLIDVGGERVNINTVTGTDKCVVLAGRLLIEKAYAEKACEFLGVPTKGSERLSYLTNALEDVKGRAQMILWEGEKKKLQAMEAKLKDLRSEDAKTQDALADIAAALG